MGDEEKVEKTINELITAETAHRNKERAGNEVGKVETKLPLSDTELMEAVRLTQMVNNTFDRPRDMVACFEAAADAIRAERVGA